MAMFKFYVVIIVVKLTSRVWIFETPLTAAHRDPTHLPNFAQVRVHCIGDAIQPSHPQPSSPSALSLSQHQGLFQWVSCSHQVTKILEFQFQHQFLRLTGLISLLFRDFQESSPAPQLEAISSLVFCLLYSPSLTTVSEHWEDHSLDYTDLCWQGDVSFFNTHCLNLSSLSCQEAIIFWFCGCSHCPQWFWSPRPKSLLPPFLLLFAMQ